MPRRRQTPHTALVRAILVWLDVHGVRAWLNNTGAIKVGTRFVRFGVKGLPDVLAVLPAHGQGEARHPPGRLAGFEVKTGRAAQTADQRAVQTNLEASGALYAVVRSIDDLEALERRGWTP